MIRHIAKKTMTLTALLCLSVLSGCISTGGNNVNARLDRHDQQLQSLLSQVGQVEQVLPGQAEMWSQMQTMRQELNMLNGKLDELHTQTTGGSSGELGYLRDKVSRLETVVRQIASQLAVNVDILNTSGGGSYAPGSGYTSGAQSGDTTSSPSGSGATTPGTAGATDAGTATDKAQALYDAGIKAFDQRRYKDAVISFKDFTAAYPKHKLAGNSHFWEGESWYQLNDFPRAALAYQQVIANYPGSPKMQSSMLKQGISLHKAGRKPAARERLQELIKRYPNSPEATSAKKFLAENN